MDINIRGPIPMRLPWGWADGAPMDVAGSKGHSGFGGSVSPSQSLRVRARQQDGARAPEQVSLPWGWDARQVTMLLIPNHIPGLLAQFQVAP